jgi:hypothetical protein
MTIVEFADRGEASFFVVPGKGPVLQKAYMFRTGRIK